MPIPLPNLDDRTFDDLVEEMKVLIPRYAPAWTDHNVSDPGIMLIELFAWLTEALIYRLNRIPESSEARFLELLGITFNPARPTTAHLTVTAQNLEEKLDIPQSTSLTAISSERKTSLRFKTTHDLYLTPEESKRNVKVLQIEQASHEQLGVSNGQPSQLFPLTRPFIFLERNEPFLFTPEITVDEIPWTYKVNLLNSSATDTHFTIETRRNAVRFGDGHMACIPPLGAKIVATYHSTLGQQGRISRNTKFAFDKDLGVHFTFSINDVDNGFDPTGLDEARDQAIHLLKTRWRAITAQDFETLVLEQTAFNIKRVKCLPEVDLTAPNPYSTRPGHISIIIVPSPFDNSSRAGFPDQNLIEDVEVFLDERRLITCQHHVAGPTYICVRATAKVSHSAQAEGNALRDQIKSNLETFFDPFIGGPESKGWPFGRNVYASEVYQVIESTGGVDHVENLTLEVQKDGNMWTDAGECVTVGPDHLVLLAADIEMQPPTNAQRTRRI